VILRRYGQRRLDEAEKWYNDPRNEKHLRRAFVSIIAAAIVGFLLSWWVWVLFGKYFMRLHTFLLGCMS